MISKKVKNDVKHVEVLSNDIIQYLLEGFIKKDIKEDNIKTEEVFEKCPCLVCGKVNSTLQILEAHTELKHKVNNLKRTLSVMKDSKEFICTECKLRYKKKTDFNRHMLIHSTSPPTK